MLDLEKGLARKSGLFTEYVDKNIKYIKTQKLLNSNKNYYTTDKSKTSSPDNNSNQINSKSKSKISTYNGKKKSNLQQIKNILEDKKLFKIQNHLINTGVLPK